MTSGPTQALLGQVYVLQVDRHKKKTGDNKIPPTKFQPSKDFIPAYHLPSPCLSSSAATSSFGDNGQTHADEIIMHDMIRMLLRAFGRWTRSVGHCYPTLRTHLPLAHRSMWNISCIVCPRQACARLLPSEYCRSPDRVNSIRSRGQPIVSARIRLFAHTEFCFVTTNFILPLLTASQLQLATISSQMFPNMLELGIFATRRHNLL